MEPRIVVLDLALRELDPWSDWGGPIGAVPI